MRKKKWFPISLALVLVASVVISLAAGACAPTAPEGAEEPEAKPVEVIEWTCQNYFPGGLEWYEITAEIDNLVAEMSDGRLIITSHPEAALVPSAEIAAAVGAGTVEMGMTCGGYHMGMIPIGALEGALPMSLTGAEMDYFFYDLGAAEIIRRGYAEHNIYWLGNYDDTNANLVSTVPIRTVADFKGLKIRSYGANAMMFDLAGAATTWMPGGELYTALSTGVVDALHYGGAFTEYELGLHEIADYYIEPPVYNAGNGANLINMDAWNALTPDLQEIVFAASMLTANWHRRLATAKNVTYLTKMIEEGIEVMWLEEESIAIMQGYATEVWAYYGEGDAYCAEYYNALMDFHRELGNVK